MLWEYQNKTDLQLALTTVIVKFDMFYKLLHPYYYFIYWEMPNNILLFLAKQISLLLF